MSERICERCKSRPVRGHTKEVPRPIWCTECVIEEIRILARNRYARIDARIDQLQLVVNGTQKEEEIHTSEVSTALGFNGVTSCPECGYDMVHGKVCWKCESNYHVVELSRCREGEQRLTDGRNKAINDLKALKVKVKVRLHNIEDLVEVE